MLNNLLILKVHTNIRKPSVRLSVTNRSSMEAAGWIELLFAWVYLRFWYTVL